MTIAGTLRCGPAKVIRDAEGVPSVSCPCGWGLRNLRSANAGRREHLDHVRRVKASMPYLTGDDLAQTGGVA